MDRIDRQIVHCLQRDGRASFHRIADVLGVSEQTVARRYRTLRSDGAVRVMILADARAGGGETWFVRVRCRPDATEAVAAAMAARDDVSWLSVTSGGAEITCVVRSRAAALGRSVLLERLPRTSQVLSFDAFAVMHMHIGGEAEWLAFDDPLDEQQIARLQSDSTSNGPSVGDGPRATILDEDAPLLAALAADGRAGVVALARVTGWPPARVSARLTQLLDTGAANVEIDLALERFGFRAAAYLWMTVPPGELQDTGQALSRHPETSFAAAVTGSANLMAAVTCRDTEALYRFVTTKVGALPAVRQAEVVPVLKRIKQAGTFVQDGRLVVR